MSSSKRKARNLTRQDLLLRELDLERVLVETRQWKRPAGLITEIEYAVCPAAHEGKLAHFGAVVSDCDLTIENTARIPMKEDDAILGRKLADGIRSFALFIAGRFEGLLVLNSGGVDEEILVSWVQTQLRRGAIVTSDSKGLARIVYPGGIVQHQNRSWREKPMVHTVLSRISKVAPVALGAPLRNILGFAYHGLSPRHIGATIVLCLRELSASEADSMRCPIDLKNLRLGFGTQEQKAILRHLLFQIDGALIVSQDGLVTGAGSHLRVSERSIDFIPPMAGTRHTSAKRFSFDCAAVVVITVSSDGPVTVFSDGLSVAGLHYVSAEQRAEGIVRIAPDRADTVMTSSYTETCPKCGKVSRIEEFVLPGWKDRETAHCNICKAELASAMCWSLDAYVIKVL